jgi:hypothetical protein
MFRSADFERLGFSGLSCWCCVSAGSGLTESKYSKMPIPGFFGQGPIRTVNRTTVAGANTETELTDTEH